MDLEMRPYFPDADKDVTTASIGLPQYYTDYMNGLFNLALQVFVQSLEVMACFPEPHSNVGDNLTKLLFATSSQDVDGRGESGEGGVEGVGSRMLIDTRTRK